MTPRSFLQTHVADHLCMTSTHESHALASLMLRLVARPVEIHSWTHGFVVDARNGSSPYVSCSYGALSVTANSGVGRGADRRVCLLLMYMVTFLGVAWIVK